MNAVLNTFATYFFFLQIKSLLTRAQINTYFRLAIALYCSKRPIAQPHFKNGGSSQVRTRTLHFFFF